MSTNSAVSWRETERPYLHRRTNTVSGISEIGTRGIWEKIQSCKKPTGQGLLVPFRAHVVKVSSLQVSAKRLRSVYHIRASPGVKKENVCIQ